MRRSTEFFIASAAVFLLVGCGSGPSREEKLAMVQDLYNVASGPLAGGEGVEQGKTEMGRLVSNYLNKIQQLESEFEAGYAPALSMLETGSKLNDKAELQKAIASLKSWRQASEALVEGERTAHRQLIQDLASLTNRPVEELQESEGVKRVQRFLDRYRDLLINDTGPMVEGFLELYTLYHDNADKLVLKNGRYTFDGGRLSIREAEMIEWLGKVAEAADKKATAFMAERESINSQALEGLKDLAGK